MSVATVPAAAAAAFIAFTTYTGCFLGCPDTGPDPQYGWFVAMTVLGVLLTISAPVLARVVIRDRRWVAIASIVPAISIISIVSIGLANQ